MSLNKLVGLCGVVLSCIGLIGVIVGPKFEKFGYEHMIPHAVQQGHIAYNYGFWILIAGLSCLISWAATYEGPFSPES